MSRNRTIVPLAAVLCFCTSCDSSLFEFAEIPLNEADVEMEIVQVDPAVEAVVTATITNTLGRAVQLQDDQQVLVQGRTLQGPDDNGRYTRTVPVADQYTITVREPTRGVEETIINTPDEFTITAPTADAAASLTEFTVTWTPAATENNQYATITLIQTIGEETTTKTLPRFEDTGTKTISYTDVDGYFYQGYPLTVVVTKINEQFTLNGTATAVVTVERSRTVTVTPGP